MTTGPGRLHMPDLSPCAVFENSEHLTDDLLVHAANVMLRDTRDISIDAVGTSLARDRPAASVTSKCPVLFVSECDEKFRP